MLVRTPPICDLSAARSAIAASAESIKAAAQRDTGWLDDPGVHPRLGAQRRLEALLDRVNPEVTADPESPFWEEVDSAFVQVLSFREHLPAGRADAVETIGRTMDGIGHLLRDKNAKYGNSILCPITLFSGRDPHEKVLDRLDDKMSRIVRGCGTEDEDVYKDIVGYLVLRRALV